VAEVSPARGRRALGTVPPEPRSIAECIRAGTLDAELAATLWLLIEARVPVLVAGATRGSGSSTLLAALLDFLPPESRVVEVRGGEETFDWLPQASELGWPGVPRRPADGSPVRPQDTVLLVPELSDRPDAGTWGDVARVAVRAAAIGYGLAATIRADSLDDVFAALRAEPVALGDDELSRLGVVLVLRRTGDPGTGDPDGGRRVVAAHYVRPIVRDAHGHLQRLGPAVLATWNPETDRFEHFGWGVTPELAARVERRAGDFELEMAARQAVLDDLVGRDITAVAAVRAALTRYRLGAASASLTDRPAPSRH
jgi:hypothetical protein